MARAARFAVPDSACRDALGIFLRSAMAGAALAVAPPAAAQGFEILGKGVEISGGTYRLRRTAEDGTVENASSAARSYRFRSIGNFIVGSWLDGGKEPTCPINGVPTPRATVYSKRGTHSAQYTCDPVREGTPSKYTEERWTYGFQSKASADGFTVVLSASHVTSRTIMSTGGGFSARSTQAAKGNTRFRLRIRDGACQVLERTEVFETRAVVDNTSGNKERMRLDFAYVNDPPANCRLLD